MENKIKNKIREYLDKRKINQMMKKYKKNGTGSISHIEIETINRCNGKCEFCPVNSNAKQRPYAKMTDELYKKIIKELEDMQYEKKLALFSNNEPFLDKEIEWKIEYARKALPKCFLYIFTNGSLLSEERFFKVIDNLDQMVIDIYDSNEAKNIKFIKELCKKDSSIRKKIIISDNISYDCIRTNRGGTAPNREKMKSVLDTKCNLFFEQFIIRPDGKVSLCCNDALGKYTLGDLNNQTIMEIWKSDYIESLRKEMITNGRRNINMCNECDVVNTSSCDWMFRHIL